MELWILFGTFALLLIIGTPVAFCLGVASLATVLYLGLPPVIVFQRLNSGVSVFALMAIPFFIFAGEIMVRGDIARRLIAVAGPRPCCSEAYRARQPPMLPPSAVSWCRK
jgi:TRAP-type mannitol/chloroaromatic compound transport system permease large subunit